MTPPRPMLHVPFDKALHQEAGDAADAAGMYLGRWVEDAVRAKLKRPSPGRTHEATPNRPSPRKDPKQKAGTP